MLMHCEAELAYRRQRIEADFRRSRRASAAKENRPGRSGWMAAFRAFLRHARV
jgi:hypothetical protein